MLNLFFIEYLQEKKMMQTFYIGKKSNSFSFLLSTLKIMMIHGVLNMKIAGQHKWF